MNPDTYGRHSLANATCELSEGVLTAYGFNTWPPHKPYGYGTPSGRGAHREDGKPNR